MEEMWKTIPEFPIYSVSSLGRVRNEKRNRVVRLSYTQEGEPKVGLFDDRDGKQKTRIVKRLVADAFLDGYTDIFNTAIHLNGDRKNNSVDNLAWRPYWFAIKYAQQMSSPPKYIKIGPVVDRRSGLIYKTIEDAAIKNGLLFSEIHLSLYDKTPVFPSWHIFDRHKETI